MDDARPAPPPEPKWGDRTRSPEGEILYADTTESGGYVWRRADELSDPASMHFHIGPAWERFVGRVR